MCDPAKIYPISRNLEPVFLTISVAFARWILETFIPLPTLKAELCDVERGEPDPDECGDAQDERGPVDGRHREVGVDPLPTLDVQDVVLQTQLAFEKGQFAHFISVSLYANQTAFCQISTKVQNGPLHYVG